MEGGTPLFPDLGKHCNEKSCRQLDFLPFRCDACDGVFCAEHSSFARHSCPNANMRDRVVAICPACKISVEKAFKEEDSVALQRHSCDPAKSRKATVCPVKRCKEILSFQNTYSCKSCGQKTCMKHRFPSDHACTAAGLLVGRRNYCRADAPPKAAKSSLISVR
ncbi:hypothetical protein SUGI_0548770 [Cryptomeria japonica]|uniref:zinc finger AN1 domain-containing stress-associated protein 12 n=1 Tax=Cryptomeria japonica TaxID=3369 RepID=UPI002408991D|nr:zinc finger AN1 domain-containing stress-associated protein 12 [Cryptomeria japonica]GLJ27940.1 hypothetical protein SUGI_0548770 [Cryptomeria japonica]